MSDEPSEENHEAPAAPKSKPPIVLIALLAINLGVSGFTLFKVMGASAPHPVPAAHAEPGPPKREVIGPLVSLDPFVVNLDEPGSPRYLKVQLQMEMVNGGAVKVFEKNKTLIRDELLGYLSGLKVASTLGAENKNQIRSQLETKVSELIGTERVRRIIFNEFVVQ
jgi:flagellar protein FliL